MATLASAMTLATLASCSGDAPPVPPIDGRATLEVPGQQGGYPTDRSGVEAGLPTHRAHAERGSAFYARYCTECHGVDGRADGVRAKALRPPPTDFSDASYMREQRPAWFYSALTRGVTGSAMARWDHRLDEQDRWDTAYFAWSMGLEQGVVEQGRQVYEDRCATCHGSDGNDEADAALATGERARSSLADIAEAIGSQHDPDDVPQEATEIDAVAAYVATFLFEP